MTDLPTPADISAAADRISGHVRRTPVMTLDVPGVETPVALKLEHLQHTGSFKPRGAFNTLLSGPVPAAGVVAASGGNHGAAVGFAAQALGHPAQIFVPATSGPAKINLVRRTGADLTVVEGRYADALAAARAHQAATGAMQIHAYDAPGTVTGQGTVMLEWEDQGLDADTVLIAVGGGGLIAGSMAWLSTRRRVVAVEPVGCATLHTALSKGSDTRITPSGIAMSALGAATIGQICHRIATAQNLPAVLVPDDAIAAAQAFLWRSARVLVEPGGATALAALLSGAYRPAPAERVAVLICGGNLDPDPLPDTT